MPETPDVTTKFKIEEAEALRRAQAYTKKIEDLHAGLRKAGKITQQESERGYKRSKELSEKEAEAKEKSVDRQKNALRALRWELVTYLFFIRKLEGLVKSAFEQIGESAETLTAIGGARVLGRAEGLDVGGLAAQLRDISNEALSAQQSISIVQQGMLADQGEFAEQYVEFWESARVAAVVGGGEAVDIFEALIKSMSEGSGAAIDGATSIFQIGDALKQYALATGQSVDELDSLEASQVIYNAVAERTNELLEAGAGELLEQADNAASLKSRWEELTTVLGIMAGDEEGLGLVATMLKSVTQLLVVYGTHVAVYFQSIFENTIGLVQDLASVLLTPPQDIVAWMTHLNRATERVFDFENIFGPEHQRRVEEMQKRMIESLGYFEDEADPTKRGPYDRFKDMEEKDYSSLVDHLLKREELLDQHGYRVAQIELDYRQRQEEIAIKYEQRVAKVERTYARSQERELRRYNQRVSNETADYYLQRQHDLEQFLLDQEYEQRKFRTKQLQDERTYQYERGLLVAEGDVLAIEDLDARYALTQQARQENYQLERREDSENFDLKRQQNKEKFEEELRQLKVAYDEQIRELTIRYREQLEEAAEQRKEDLRRAKQSYEDRLAAEDHAISRSLEQWAQYWTELAKKTELGTSTIKNILQNFYGPGGEADLIIQQFMERFRLRAQLATQLQNVLTGRTYTPPSVGGTDWWYGESTPPGGSQAYQHGGEGIVSRPTLLKVGEVPERFSVQPLSSVGGSLTLRWQGGAIPLQGSGGMEGLDLSGVGDALVQGLVVALTGALNG